MDEKDLKTVGEFITKAKIGGVRIRSLDAKLLRDPNPDDDPYLSLNIETGLVGHTQEDDVLNVVMKVTIAVSGHKDEKAEGNPVSTLEAEYQLGFVYQDPVSGELVEELSQTFIPSLLAPFFRELYHSISHRFDLPILAMNIMPSLPE